MKETAVNRMTGREVSQPWRWFSGWSAHTYATIVWFLSLILFWEPLSGLVSLSVHDERSSHIILIPFISAYLIYLQRKRILSGARYCPAVGLPLLLTAAVLWYGLRGPLSFLNTTDRLSVVAALIVLVWIAVFILYLGLSSFKVAAFPLLFLLLMIPLPVVVAEHIVSILQKGSAETCYVLFRLIGIPVVRQGFRFSLPSVTIEVAKQCSGIHSGLSLLITGLLVEHIFLQAAWRKIFFVLLIFPIAVIKNAARIVTISCLGIYVDRSFFFGALHRHSGLPFSVLGLAMMALVLWLLRRGADFPRGAT